MLSGLVRYGWLNADTRPYLTKGVTNSSSPLPPPPPPHYPT